MTTELRQVVEGIRFIERMNDHPHDKDAIVDEMTPLRQIFTKSMVAKLDLPAGTVLRAEHLGTKKPGTGIPAARLPELVGRTLRHAIKADQFSRKLMWNEHCVSTRNPTTSYLGKHPEDRAMTYYLPRALEFTDRAGQL